MKLATLGIIIKGEQVLLGRKQGNPEIGDGTLNAPGGKVEPGESLLECLVREVEEEVGIVLDPAKVREVAIIKFYAGKKLDFEVHVYLTSDFTGEPRETKSMVPAWYNFDDLPLDDMLESDREWFPALLEGHTFRAEVFYRERAKGYIKTSYHRLIPFGI